MQKQSVTNTSQNYIKSTGVSKSYVSGAGSVQVLNDCSFEIEAGKLNVIMGSSGCGKSTLAYLLAGYIMPDQGEIRVDNQLVTGPGSDRILVFQETALWPWMTVMDNVTFGPRVSASLSRGVAKKTALELLDQFGLSDFKNKYPGQLSGGMKRRVEIAQALINTPKVMILDEPFRGLDVLTRQLLQEYYLAMYEKTRLTTVFITSELEEALFLADRIYVMSDTPSRIARIVEVDLPRPRNFDVLATDQYQQLQDELLEVLYENTKERPATVS